MVATPARPETTTTETNPLDNEVDGEASNTEANTANADTNNPLDNEVEGDAPDGDSANLDEPNIPGASSKPTSARLDRSARIDEGTRLDESARIDEGTRLDEGARIDERARVDKWVSVDERARGGLAETQPRAQEMRGSGNG